MALLPCQLEMLSTRRVFEEDIACHCPRRRTAIFAPLSTRMDAIVTFLCEDCSIK